MSERKRGGLDYTPRAFPGARDPDGPAPDMEAKLAQLGLLEGAEPIEVRPSNVRADASAESKPVAKKRAALEYTPQAFPGARDPDGPAPGLEERLIKSGWAKPAETREFQPGARPGASPAPPPARREQPAAPPPASNRPAPDGARAPVQTSSREPAGVQPPLSSERTASPASSPNAQRPQFAATPQPVYLASAIDEKLDDLAHLRGLDCNTAVSIAIVQDWVACFGLQARQAGR